jgi:hypothetical protein
MRMGNDNVNRLVGIIADRFAAIAPPPIRPHAENGWLYFGGTVFPFAENYYEAGGGDEAVLAVSVKALNEFQDEVSLLTHEPWPGEHSQPKAAGAIEDRILYLWYGSREAPVLECMPVDCSC